jgi:hypothetical protein
MAKKFRGIQLRFLDKTVPMTKEEEQIAKKLKRDDFRIPRWFNVRINNAIPPSHRICY